MEILESFMNSRVGMYLIMIAIVGIIVLFLRFLYGPKGIFRKNLWDGIDDDIDEEKDKSKVNTKNTKKMENTHKNN